MENPLTDFKASREIAAPIEQVFAAFSQPERLARWWGPAGFTNTFQTCEFKTGGRWSYVMHGPDKRGNYVNESMFVEIEPPKKVVIQHISEPKYRLTITLASTKAGGSFVSWLQVFESEDMAERVRRVVGPANEENLDRLTAEVLNPPA